MHTDVAGNRFFTLGELFAGSEGMLCEAPNGCKERTSTIRLSREDVLQLNSQFPKDVEEGIARGPEAANFILTHKLSNALCDTHLK